MILYIENPKDSIRKLLELISELAKLQNTKSIHRNHLHFYILIMKNQKEKLRNQSTKCNLQIQCDSYQITNGIFHRTRTKNFTIHKET